MEREHLHRSTRQNVSVSDIECWIDGIVEHKNSRPRHEIGGGRRFPHSTEHLFLAGSSSRPVLLGSGHSRSARDGLLHRGLHSFHQQSAQHHGHPSLQQLRRNNCWSATRRTDHSDRLVSQSGEIDSVLSLLITHSKAHMIACHCKINVSANIFF